MHDRKVDTYYKIKMEEQKFKDCCKALTELSGFMEGVVVAESRHEGEEHLPQTLYKLHPKIAYLADALWGVEIVGKKA